MSGTTGMTASLVAREEELSRLRGLVAPPLARSRVLLILGDPGIGKTVLLAEAARAARSAGLSVLATAGHESERDLAFAGLHQLLRPVIDRLSGLPPRQAGALRSALAISDDPAAPDALLTGVALLTLLSVLSAERPLLVIADDAQWLDHASSGALGFAARRLASEQLVLLVAARGKLAPPGFERDFPQLMVSPLSLPDAGRLLDRQPRPPRGRTREQILRQAGGNPLALVELTKTVVADPQSARRWSAEPLPLTDRLTAIMAAQYADLPATARAALLVAAIADRADLPMALLPGRSAEALAPAEEVGLIRVDTSGPQFAHPLVRSAVYHAAPFAERAAAHLKVAAALREEPDRYAWHLASAALEPDEHVAGLLESSAVQAQRRGGAAAAARALERAAELSPVQQDRARRLLSAAQLAHYPAGQADWARDMAGRVLALTSDPDLRIAARLNIGWSLIWSNRNADALNTLLAVAADAAGWRPGLAWEATALAATVAHQTGLPQACARARAALDALIEPQLPAEDWTASSADELRLWINACTGPFTGRAETVRRLLEMAEGPLSEPDRVAGAAWILDETDVALRVLQAAVSRLRAPGVSGASGAVLSVLEWACIDSGRWDDALAAAAEAGDIAAAYKMETVAGSADLTVATVAALRGEHEQVAPLLERVQATVDISEYRGFAVRIRHAAALDALARGNYLAAWAQLGKLFAADGTPLHHHFSYLGIADLAAAAVRAERRLEAGAMIERALALVEPSPRLEQLAARARALVAEPADAEQHFATGLAVRSGASWPFERAQLQLDYGKWLRRRRRINDAKGALRAALETFRHLDAAPWTDRAVAELRACGVIEQAPSNGGAGLEGLTAQQREIVVLAARGLTNGEIADRMFLSPHTVASHLYRSYPKLGIAARHQLRDIISARNA